MKLTKSSFFLIVFGMVLSNGLYAQAQKIGHVNTQEILAMMNDNWIRPIQGDKPANFTAVEKGCYW